MPQVTEGAATVTKNLPPPPPTSTRLPVLVGATVQGELTIIDQQTLDALREIGTAVLRELRSLNQNLCRATNQPYIEVPDFKEP